MIIFGLGRCSADKPDTTPLNIPTGTASKINSENETKRKDELKKVIKNSDQIIDEIQAEGKAVDEAIEKKVEEADKKIQEVRKEKGRDVTGPELEEILKNL